MHLSTVSVREPVQLLVPARGRPTTASSLTPPQPCWWALRAWKATASIKHTVDNSNAVNKIELLFATGTFTRSQEPLNRPCRSITRAMLSKFIYEVFFFFFPHRHAALVEERANVCVITTTALKFVVSPSSQIWEQQYVLMQGWQWGSKATSSGLQFSRRLLQDRRVEL